MIARRPNPKTKRTDDTSNEAPVRVIEVAAAGAFGSLRTTEKVKTPLQPPRHRARSRPRAR